jgi:ribonuclease Z
MLTFLITLLATALLFLGQSDGRIATTIYSALGIASAQAAGGKVEGPNVVAPDRYVYYPGTEKVDRKEIRLTACGTSTPPGRGLLPDGIRQRRQDHLRYRHRLDG